MHIEWNHFEQTSRFMNTCFFFPFYQNLNREGKDCKLMRLSAPVIGVIDAFVCVVQTVARVVEAVLKGLRNVGMGLLTAKGEFLKEGIFQVLIGGLYVGAISLPVIFFRTLYIMKGLITDPEMTTYMEAQMHLP